MIDLLYDTLKQIAPIIRFIIFMAFIFVTFYRILKLEERVSKLEDKWKYMKPWRR